jgi:flavodoxin
MNGLGYTGQWWEVIVMDVLIICFSQTGNTRKLADRISKGIVDSGKRCRIIEMKHARIDEIPNYDLIGIGTPTFFYREPVNDSGSITPGFPEIFRQRGEMQPVFTMPGKLPG